MTYDQIIEILKSNYFYPGKIKELTNNKETVTGLFIYTPPILKDDRIKRLKEILNDDCKISWVGGEKNEIHITVK